MEVINVISTNITNGIDSVKSFPISDESQKAKVVEEAKTFYKKKALELGFEEDEIEESYEDGFISKWMGSVTLAWSE